LAVPTAKLFYNTFHKPLTFSPNLSTDRDQGHPFQTYAPVPWG
jgi:hypothetical protein